MNGEEHQRKRRRRRNHAPHFAVDANHHRAGRFRQHRYEARRTRQRRCQPQAHSVCSVATGRSLWCEHRTKEQGRARTQWAGWLLGGALFVRVAAHACRVGGGELASPHPCQNELRRDREGHTVRNKMQHRGRLLWAQRIRQIGVPVVRWCNRCQPSTLTFRANPLTRLVLVSAPRAAAAGASRVRQRTRPEQI